MPFFLVLVLVNRKQTDHLKLCYLAIFLIKNGFPFNIISLKKCSANEIFNL